MSATEYPNAWRFETAAGTIPVSWLEGTQPAPKRGDTADFDVVFVRDGRGDHVARYEQLLAYRDFAGEYTLHEIEGGTVAYTETHAGGSPGGSLLVGVRPADDDRTGRGIWGLIGGVSDDAPDPETRAPATLSLVYLAPIAQSDSEPGYQTRAALADALQADQL